MKHVFLTIAILSGLSLPSCKYDDAEIWDKVNDLDERLTSVETAVETMNRNVETLQRLIDGKLFISALDENGDGSYTLKLVTPAGELSSLTVRNGRDGASGTTPRIGVRQDSDGRYYWTVNDEWVVDETGGKLAVTGSDGAAGADGVTPVFKIDNGRWYVSYDRGLSYIECGKAAGDDGDAFFKDARLSDDGRTAYLTLADGTVLAFEVYREFGIAFDVTNLLVLSGETREIPFTLTGADENTVVEAIGKNGFEAEAELPAGGVTGKLLVTAPDAPVIGKVIVLVNDGADKTLMRTLTFVSGYVRVTTSSVEATAAGGTFEAEVVTNLDYAVSLPEETTWVRLLEGSRAYEVRTDRLTLQIDANDTPYTRETVLTLRHEGLEIETILVCQQPVAYDEGIMVLRVRSDASTGAVKLPLYQSSGAVAIDWGDGSDPTVVAQINSAATRYPSHTYEKKGEEYTVQVSGALTAFSGTSASYSAGLIDIVQWGELPFSSISLQGNPDIARLPAPADGAFADLATLSFSGCTGLQSVERGFLRDAVKLDNAQNLFSGCTSLTEVPDDLFDNCTALRTAASAFKNCKSIRKTPAFRNSAALTNASALFSGCEALTEVPDDLFPASMAATTNINSMFQNCKSLETVPAGVFRYFGEKITIANMLFDGCEKLRTLDFEFLNRLTKCYTWTYAFRNCSSLKGGIPTCPVEIDGQTVEVELWQRGETQYRSYFANRALSGGGCFTGATQIDGYYDRIPQSWGGGWDGSTAAPAIAVTASLPEGEEYYAVDFNVKGKNVVSAYYFLSAKAAVEAALPEYNNSYADLCNAEGIAIESDYLDAINSSDGLTLYFDGGVPETEYILIVSGKNMFGESYARCAQATAAVPKGEEGYERFLGQWTVTSASSASTSEAYEQRPVSFDIRIEPYRVDRIYLVYGWGVTQFTDRYPVLMYYEDGRMNAYTGAAHGSVLYQGYSYTDETYGTIAYNACVESYGWLSEGYFGVYMTTGEKILEGVYDTASGTATLSGVPSEYYNGQIVCAGMEVFLAMGGLDWSHIFIPAEIVKPQYVFTYGDERLIPYTLAPYTLVRQTAAASPSAAARTTASGKMRCLPVGFAGRTNDRADAETIDPGLYPIGN